MTWTFTGQPYLLWPAWVQACCEIGRDCDESPAPKFEGQVVHRGDCLIVNDDGEVGHEWGAADGEG